MQRLSTKTVKIGNRVIGGGNPVLIQSMTNTKTEDAKATAAQVNRLAAVGCDIIRCAIPTMEAAQKISEIKKNISIPLVADIHFDYRLAIAAIEYGADKIRINPGNIGGRERLKAVSRRTWTARPTTPGGTATRPWRIWRTISWTGWMSWTSHKTGAAAQFVLRGGSCT